MKRHIYILAATAATLAFSACEKQPQTASEGDVIHFTTELAPVVFNENGEAETKALASDRGSIAVYITQGELSDDAFGTKSINWIKNPIDVDKVIKKFSVACHNGSSYEFTGGVYDLENRRWEGTERHFHGDPQKTLTFYTYASIQGPAATAPVMNTSGAVPTISYSMPEAIDDQHDLVAACSVASDKSTENVALTFKHILSTIRIRDEIASAGYKIKYIHVIGMYSQGSFALSKENLTPLSDNKAAGYGTSFWTNLSSKRDISMPTYIKDGETTFSTPSDELGCMIIPQNTEGSYLRIGFEKDGLLQEAVFNSSYSYFSAGMYTTFWIMINKV